MSQPSNQYPGSPQQPPQNQPPYQYPPQGQGQQPPYPQQPPGGYYQQPPPGYPPQQYPPQGYPPQQYPPQGYPPQQYPQYPQYRPPVPPGKKGVPVWVWIIVAVVVVGGIVTAIIKGTSSGPTTVTFKEPPSTATTQVALAPVASVAPDTAVIALPTATKKAAAATTVAPVVVTTAPVADDTPTTAAAPATTTDSSLSLALSTEPAKTIGAGNSSPVTTSAAKPTTPAASSKPTTAVATKGGLGVARNTVQLVFEKQGFKFSEGQAVNGQPNLVATGKNSSQMQLIGPANNLINTSIAVIASATDKDVNSTSVLYAETFLALIMPDWDGGNDWFISAIDKLSDQDSVETTYKNRHVTLNKIVANDGAVLILTIEAL